jgi:hypothetical protein
MKMPRFTAEASLYKTSEHYQMATSFTQTGEAVIPQFWFPPPLCTYDTCMAKIDCGADPLIDCKVIGKTSQRCCSWFGSTVCMTVGCPEYCLEKKANWLADCNEAAPGAEEWCSNRAEQLYKHCSQSGEWFVAPPSASCYQNKQDWIYYLKEKYNLDTPEDCKKPDSSPYCNSIIYDLIVWKAEELYIQCLDTGVWKTPS